MLYTSTMHHYSEKKRFSIVKRAKSLTHAYRGIIIFIKTQHNAWIHLAVGLAVVILGFIYRIGAIEWALLIFAIAIVLVTEAVNTAIEIDIDLTSPGQHPYARDTKDVAAGAVLVATIFAIIIGVVVFLPYLTKTF